MRRKNNMSAAGCVCIFIGLFIILSLILPSGFWWFILGSCLIGLGIYRKRRCCGRRRGHEDHLYPAAAVSMSAREQKGGIIFLRGRAYALEK